MVNRRMSRCLTRSNRSRVAIGWLLIVVACGLIGCGSRSTKPDPSPTNLRQIQALYRVYTQVRGGVGPRDANEFKRFIRAEGSGDAQRLHVDLTQLDQLFISPRDEQPYLINYGLRLADEQNKRQIIVAERVGHNGKRAIGDLRGWVEEVDADQAAELDLKTS
jgi:hypothetical protein